MAEMGGGIDTSTTMVGLREALRQGGRLSCHPACGGEYEVDEKVSPRFPRPLPCRLTREVNVGVDTDS